MTSPEFIIIDDPAAKADLARIQAMLDRLHRAMRESRATLDGRAERGPVWFMPPAHEVRAWDEFPLLCGLESRQERERREYALRFAGDLARLHLPVPPVRTSGEGLRTRLDLVGRWSP